MAKKAKKDLTLEEKLQKALVADWEQPYALPENWVWSYLGKCFEWGSGGTPSRKNIEYFQGSIPWVKTGELGKSYIVDTEEKITEEAVKNSSAKLYPINTVIIAMYGATIGKVAVLGIPATTNQACACAKPGIISHKLLYFYIILKKSNLIELGKGGAQPNISQDIIKQVPFPLPPLAEQERIVQRIESLFAKLDTAKELLEEALESFESRKSALLHQAFTGELTKAWREKHDVSMETWEEKTLSETDITIIDGDRGQNYPKKEEFSPSGFCLFLNTKNVTKKGFSFNKLEFISQEKDLLLRKGKLSRGDVVLTTRGTIGNIAFYDFQVPFEHMRINSGMVIFRFTKELLQNFFLLQFYSSHITNQISLIQSGSAQPQLPIKDLKKIFIKIPTLPEQEEIVRILDAQLQKEEEASAHIQHSLERIEHMKKAILARAFRGELGTNNPEEASAVELLKEILSQERPTPKEKKPSKKFAIPKELTKELAITVLEKFIYESIAEKQEVTIQEILSYDKDSLKVIQSLDRMEKMKIIAKSSDTKYIIKD